MGKAGKMRKRGRLEAENHMKGSYFGVLSRMNHADEDEEENDNEDNDSKSDTDSASGDVAKMREAVVQNGSTARLLREDVDYAAELISILSKNISLFKSKQMKALRTELFPLLELQKAAYFEQESLKEVQESELTVFSDKKALAKLSKVIQHFAGSKQGIKEFQLPENKHFRKALHPLVLSAFNLESKSVDRSFSALVSTALHDKDWERALKLLIDMRHSSEVPKLGALQRWVRECDVSVVRDSLSASLSSATSQAIFELGSFESNISWLLQDAVMRVFNREVHQAVPTSSSSAAPVTITESSQLTIPPLTTNVKIHKYPPFVAPEISGVQCTTKHAKPLPSKEHITNNISVVSHVSGPMRRPPSRFDLNVYTNTPNLIDLSFLFKDSRLDSTIEPVRRYDIPGVPGAFLLKNVLSEWACKQMIHLAENVGYVPDAVEGIDNVFWLPDDKLLAHVFQRCESLLPPIVHTHNNQNKLQTHELRGINATWRLFRYFPGSVYHPHIDGAWPGSGIRKDTGVYAQDAFDGDRFSKLTFLVYLNDDFEGGETTFYLPANDLPIGNVNALRVRPTAGSVLCFPHGDAMGSLVHEGSEVFEKNTVESSVGDLAAGDLQKYAKYVIRTDVLYSTPIN